MGNNLTNTAKGSGFWQVAFVASSLIAMVALILAASFFNDLAAQRTRADQATQQVAAATDLKAKADQAAADLAAATGQADQAKAKVAELTGQLATATKERDEFKVKAEALAAEVAAKAEKKPAHP